MSLILDALRKSEQERPAAESAPGLQAAHAPVENSGHGHLARWVWPGLTLALTVGVLLLWFDGKEIALTPASVSPPPAQSVAPPVMAIAEPQPTVTVVTELTELTVDIEVEESAPPAIDAGVAALYAQAEPVVVEPVVKPAAPATKPAAQRPRATPQSDVDALTKAAQAALQETAVAEHTAPLIADLSQRTKDEIPSIFFSAHRWASNPNEREVVLNGTTYHEGAVVKPGLKLLEILPDSILLDYRGTEFRLRALNSWVNL